MQKWQNTEIQSWPNTKGENTNCLNTDATKYKWNKIQIAQHAKIQMQQNSKGQNTNRLIQMEQNKNRTKLKHTNIQT